MTREEQDQLHKDNLDLLNRSSGDGYAEKTYDFMSRIIAALPVADPAPVGDQRERAVGVVAGGGTLVQTGTDTFACLRGSDPAPAPTELEAAVGELLAVVDSNISTHPQFLGTIARVRAAMGRKA